MDDAVKNARSPREVSPQNNRENKAVERQDKAPAADPVGARAEPTEPTPKPEPSQQSEQTKSVAPQDQDTLVENLQSLDLDQKQIEALLFLLNQEGHAELKGLLQALSQSLTHPQAAAANDAAMNSLQQLQILANLPKQEARMMEFLTQAGLTEEEAGDLLAKLQLLKNSFAQTGSNAGKEENSQVRQTGNFLTNNGDNKTPAKLNFTTQLQHSAKPGETGPAKLPVDEMPAQGGKDRVGPTLIGPEKISVLQTSRPEDVILDGKPRNNLIQSGLAVNSAAFKGIESAKPRVEFQIQQANAVAENPAKTVEVSKPVTPESATLRNLSARQVVQQIANKISFRAGSSQNEIQIRLEPPSLGTVRMSISTTGESIRTLIVTDNQAVKQIIENNLAQLRDSMNGQGLKVDSFTVLVGGNSEQAWQQGNRFEKGPDFAALSNLMDPVSGIEASEPIPTAAPMFHGGTISVFA